MEGTELDLWREEQWRSKVFSDFGEEIKREVIEDV